MKIDKAIEYLGMIRDGENPVPEPEWTAACSLGIEALTREREARAGIWHNYHELLPGETEEVK